MKKLKLNIKRWKIKLTVILLILLCVVAGVYSATVRINEWFDGHEMRFNPPVEVKFNPLVEILEREAQINEIIRVVEELPKLDNLSPIEDYICEKWGVYDCRVALAVSKAENGTRQPDRFNVNGNGSIDIGIFQINSVHFTKEGCSLAEIVDPYKNVDCAYQIYEASGWSPWVAFTSSAFVKHLDN